MENINVIIKKEWIIAAVIILVAVLFIPQQQMSVFSSTPTASDPPPIPTPPIPPAITTTLTPTGTATPNLPITTDEWYPVGDAVEFFVFDTKVKIQVPEKPPDGNIAVVLENPNLWNSGKELLVQLRFKDSNTGEIFESQITNQLQSGTGIRAWGLVMGNTKINPNQVQWQPKFGLRDRNIPKTKKVILQ